MNIKHHRTNKKQLLATILILSLAATVLASCFVSFPTTQGASLSNYKYRTPIVVDPIANAGLGYVIHVNIYAGAGASSGINLYENNHGASVTFADVTFTANDCSTTLSFWQQEDAIVSNVSSIFWIKLSADISVSGTTIYAYYGNPTVQTSASNGATTFIDFDDFSAASLNTTKWTTSTLSAGTITQSGGSLTLNCPSYLNKAQVYSSQGESSRNVSVIASCTYGRSGNSYNQETGFKQVGANKYLFWDQWRNFAGQVYYGMAWGAFGSGTVCTGATKLYEGSSGKPTLWVQTTAPTVMKIGVLRNGPSYIWENYTGTGFSHYRYADNVAASTYAVGDNIGIALSDGTYDYTGSAACSTTYYWVALAPFAVANEPSLTYGSEQYLDVQFSQISQSTAEQGVPVQFTANMSSLGPSLIGGGYIFSINTGLGYINDTFVAFQNNAVETAIVEKTLSNIPIGTTISYVWYACSSSGVKIMSDVHTYTLTATVTYYFNDHCLLSCNGVLVTNGTSITYNTPTTLKMIAAPDGPGIEFQSFALSNPQNTITYNNYDFSVSSHTDFIATMYNATDIWYGNGYTAGYTNGWSYGNATGYTTGWSDGNMTGYAAGWIAGNCTGYEAGYTAGYNAAYSQGYNAGWANGNLTGTTTGYALGYSSGWNSGWTAGYNAGWLALETQLRAVLDATHTVPTPPNPP